MRKYWAFFRCFLATILEYRSIPVAWAIIELVAIISIVFLWLAIYRDYSMVGSYTARQILFYYSLIPLIGIFTYTYVSSSLPKQIKDGKISIDLIKPYNLALVVFLRQVSIKAIQLIFKIPVFLVFIWVVTARFGINFNSSFLTVAIVISLFSFVLHFLIDLCLSYAAFWMDDVWSLKHLKTIVMMVFSGMTFPLDLIPDRFMAIFNFLPFRFIYFLPITIARGNLSSSEILASFFQIIAWILFFYFCSEALWQQGLKKYQAYGN